MVNEPSVLAWRLLSSSEICCCFRHQPSSRCCGSTIISENPTGQRERQRFTHSSHSHILAAHFRSPSLPHTTPDHRTDPVTVCSAAASSHPPLPSLASLDLGCTLSLPSLHSNCGTRSSDACLSAPRSFLSTTKLFFGETAQFLSHVDSQQSASRVLRWGS